MLWTQTSPEGLALTRAKPLWIAMTVKHAASVILRVRVVHLLLCHP